MVAAVTRVARSRHFIVSGLVFLVSFYGGYWAPVLWAVAFPPYTSHSIEVVVADGVPVRVVEVRDIAYPFTGEWRVKVVDVDRSRVRCDLPPSGPRSQPYSLSDTPAFEPSWDGYTSGGADCLDEMAAHPGFYFIETHRRAWVWYRWVDLPVSRSLTFEVGGTA